LQDRKATDRVSEAISRTFCPSRDAKVRRRVIGGAAEKGVGRKKGKKRVSKRSMNGMTTLGSLP
jgi:hypothetical protein